MRLVPVLLAHCLLFVAHTAVAANIVCPESIVETPNVSTEAKGWTSVAPTGKRWLENVGIYYGSILDHLELGAQVPEEKTGKTIATATWGVARDKNGNDTNAYWIGCSYRDTNAKFFQKVDAAATTCVATYDLLPPGKWGALKTMVCQ